MSLDPSYFNPIIFLLILPGFVWVGFHLLARSANESLKHDIADFFIENQTGDENPYRNSKNSLLVQYYLLIQQFFGHKLISWKSVVLSCAISYAIILLFGFPSLLMIPSFRQEFFWYLMYSIFFTSPITFYICLLKSRWVLGKLIKFEKGLVVDFCLFLNYLVTTLVIVLSFFISGNLWGLKGRFMEEGNFPWDFEFTYKLFYPAPFKESNINIFDLKYIFTAMPLSYFFFFILMVIYIAGAKNLKFMCRINGVEKLVKNFVVNSNWVKAIGNFVSLGIFIFSAVVFFLTLL